MLTVKIGGQEFPSKCPDDCPGHDEPFMQGGLCHRCPIFNCIPEPYDPEKFVLLRPDDYRPDWAKAWKDWFDNGMQGLPKLYL